jgi:hypothetical protein
MNLIPILNKTSLQTHTELKLDMLGIPRKLLKYKKLKIEKKFLSLTQTAQTIIDHFFVSRTFRGLK